MMHVTILYRFLLKSEIGFIAVHIYPSEFGRTWYFVFEFCTNLEPDKHQYYQILLWSLRIKPCYY